MACGERCCCILGGCGCGPRMQLEALTALIMEKTGSRHAQAMDAAIEILDIFGTGPHKERMRELGLSAEQIEMEAAG